MKKEGGEIIGVITWNLFGKMGVAKKVKCGQVYTRWYWLVIQCCAVAIHDSDFCVRCFFCQIIADGKTEGDIGEVVRSFDLHNKSSE